MPPPSEYFTVQYGKGGVASVAQNGCLSMAEKPQAQQFQHELRRSRKVHKQPSVQQHPIVIRNFRPERPARRSRFKVFLYSCILPAIYLYIASDKTEDVRITFNRLCMNASTYYRELISWVLSNVTDADMFLIHSFVTCGALSWLLHRAWQTLWKPVPELINILGVEVPEAPEVSLAGIKADAVTLHWTRPAANKTVTRYLIQVNGVNIGESSRLETAITVTELKPGHFYNVRVIAVKSNNFQSGSRILRLRTYGRDGRPLIGSRSLSPDSTDGSDHGDGVSRKVLGRSVGIESANIPVIGSTLPRESSGNDGQCSGGHVPQRKNAMAGRKESTSTSITDRESMSQVPRLDDAKESMQQLTERFEAIRKGTDDLVTLGHKEAQDFKLRWEELLREREEQKGILKEKEEANERLKKEVHSSERANRQAQNRKTQKEKILKAKGLEMTKMQDDIVRWKHDIAQMRSDEAARSIELEKLSQERERRSEELRKSIRLRQKSVNELEEIIRVKGLQIKKIEEERKKLHGYRDDDEAREQDSAGKRQDAEWEEKEREWGVQLYNQDIQLQSIQMEYVRAQATLSTLRTRQKNNPVYDASSSTVDLNSVGQPKITSRTGRTRGSWTNTLSSITNNPMVESSPPSTNSYSNVSPRAPPGLAQGPFFEINKFTTMSPLVPSAISGTDVATLNAGVPLSPTATALLPSNIFADEESSSSRLGPSTRMCSSNLIDPSCQYGDPHTPSSSSRSTSLISSPRTSANNLSIFGTTSRGLGLDNDRGSLTSPRADSATIGSPADVDPEAIAHKDVGFFDYYSNRSGVLENGPPLGSLKQGQSQSFPSSGVDININSPRSRRPSFSTRWNFPNFLTRSPAPLETSEGNAPAPARHSGSRRARGLGTFGHSVDERSSVYSDRDPSSPGPLSIASFDLPRPSTDSAPFGWPVTDFGPRYGPLAPKWVLNAPQTWVGNPTRRTSHRHATSGLLSLDDEILPRDSINAQSNAPPVGVIGTRPSSSHKPVTPQLDAAPPTFDHKVTRSTKANKGLGKERTQQTLHEDLTPNNASPSKESKSRDAHSMQVLYSKAHPADSLEPTSSNHFDTLFDALNGKDREISFQQLLRKGSSSKFGFSSKRSRDSGLFSKRRGSSTANSDRNPSVERDSSFDNVADRGVQSGPSNEGLTGTSTSTFLSPDGGKGNESSDGGPRTWGRAWRKKRKDTSRESEDMERSGTEMTGTEDDEG